MRIFIALFALSIYVTSYSLKLSLKTPIGQNFSTETTQGYDQIVDFLKTQEDKKNEFGDYYRTCKELTSLACNTRGALIDSAWWCLARHNADTYRNDAALSHLDYRGWTTAFSDPTPNKTFDFSAHYKINNDLDIALAWSQYPFTSASPIKRYYGNLVVGTEVLVYSDALHLADGNVMQYLKSYGRAFNNSPSKTTNNLGLFVPCRVSEVHGAEVVLKPQHSGQIKAITIGGDSNSPCFIKVQEHGTPDEKYRYVGVNYAPGEQRIAIVNIGSPSVADTVNKIILAKALGSGNAVSDLLLGDFTRVDDDMDSPQSPPLPKLDQNDEENIKVTCSEWLQKAIFPIGTLLDPTWVIGTKENVSTGEFFYRFKDGTGTQKTTIQKMIPLNNGDKPEKTLALGKLAQPLAKEESILRFRGPLNTSAAMYLVSNRPYDVNAQKYAFYFSSGPQVHGGEYAKLRPTSSFSLSDQFVSFRQVQDDHNPSLIKDPIANEEDTYFQGNGAPIIIEAGQNNDQLAFILSSMDDNGDNIKALQLTPEIQAKIDHEILKDALTAGG